MTKFHSINLARAATVAELSGSAVRLGALPSQAKALSSGERIENDRVRVEPGTRLVLQVEGGERLTLEVAGSEPRIYFFHIVDEEGIGHRLMK